jgi:hypothetical protein
MSSEWHIPDTAILVRQGDLLICRDPHTGVVEEICLVITADCDISKGKFGKQLACLRIITFQEYLRKVWSVRKLEDVVESATGKILERVNKWNSDRIGSKSNLSAEAVTAWVRRSEPEEICTYLNIPEKEVKKVQLDLSFFKAALAVLNDDPVSDKLQQLAAFRSARFGKTIEDCWQEVLQQAKNEKKPDDVFLLPALPQLEIGPAVVLLREIVGVRYDAVCYTTLDACTNEMFLRIGRLEPTFKYAVSQAFGSLYSRIGLPDDYESRCKKVFDQITELVWE